MYCLPERRNHCKTSIFKKSADPEFNEMFSFDVPYNQLANRMLQVRKTSLYLFKRRVFQFTVYDFDRFTRHGLIGNVIMRDLFDKSDLYNWTEFTMQIVGSQVGYFKHSYLNLVSRRKTTSEIYFSIWLIRFNCASST
jgi:hypothetical protein